MTVHSEQKDRTRNLSEDACWRLLRTESVARLAVIVDDHPDIFPFNYAVDRGTLVFRTGEGTKLSSALTGNVAVETDGYDQESHQAWSIVIKGKAQTIVDFESLIDTFDLPVFPWHAGEKRIFVRVTPTSVTGRQFHIADRTLWASRYSGKPRTAPE